MHHLQSRRTASALQTLFLPPGWGKGTWETHLCCPTFWDPLLLGRSHVIDGGITAHRVQRCVFPLSLLGGDNPCRPSLVLHGILWCSYPCVPCHWKQNIQEMCCLVEGNCCPPLVKPLIPKQGGWFFLCCLFPVLIPCSEPQQYNQPAHATYFQTHYVFKIGQLVH